MGRCLQHLLSSTVLDVCNFSKVSSFATLSRQKPATSSHGSCLRLMVGFAVAHSSLGPEGSVGSAPSATGNGAAQRHKKHISGACMKPALSIYEPVQLFPALADLHAQAGCRMRISRGSFALPFPCVSLYPAGRSCTALWPVRASDLACLHPGTTTH